MILKTRRRTLPSVPISAMSDIGFLLLIFIMLVSLINYRQEVKIEYPEATEIHKTQADHNFEIWVTPTGEVIHKGKALDASSLEKLLVEAYTLHPDQRIHIIADKNTPFVHLSKVMEILQLLQHRVVSLVIKEN